MRFYPVLKNPRVFVEETPSWKRKWTCYDEWNQYYRRTHKTCAAPCPVVYYPELNVDRIREERLKQYCENRCTPLKQKKKKKDKKKKRERWQRIKNYPIPTKPVRNYYREYNLDRNIPLVKAKDLYFDRWDKNRRKPDRLVRLPMVFRGTRMNSIQFGPPNRFTDRFPTMNYTEIDAIIQAEKLAIALALKAKREAKRAAKKGKKGKR